MLLSKVIFSRFAYAFSLWWRSIKTLSAVMVAIPLPDLNKRKVTIKVNLSDNHLPALGLHSTMVNGFVFMEDFWQVLLRRRQSDTILGNDTGKVKVSTRQILYPRVFTGLDPLFLGQSLSQRSPEELSVAPKASLAAPVLAFQYINGALRWDFGNVRHTQELAEQSCFLEDFTSYHLGWKLAAGQRPKPTRCIGLVLFTFMGMGLIPSWGPRECTCMVQSCLCHWAFIRGAVYQLL